MKIRTVRQLGIMVVLALEGPDIRRERLVALFWPDVSERKARHSLTQALSELKQATSPDFVVTSRTHAQLGRPCTTDLDLLQSDPDSVLRGSPLEGMDAWGGLDLAQWLDATRERLRREATRLLEPLLQHSAAHSDIERLARLLQKLDPLNDRATLVLVDRDLAEGNLTGAVRRLRLHQDAVTAELGFAPESPVSTLLGRFERGDIERARHAIVGDPLRIESTPVRLVGRDAELAEIEKAWGDVCAGATRALRISGSQGIGKSAILRHVLSGLASRGYHAFLTTCHEAMRAVPFALLSDLIDALSADPGFAASDPTWLAEASRIHPILRKQFPGVPEPVEAPPESVRERQAEALAETIKTITEGRPIALAIDDVDRGDQASLSVINRLRQRLHSQAMLLLMTSAPPEGTGEPLLSSANRHLSLEGLPHSAMCRLIGAQLAPTVDSHSAVVVQLARLADGNPLFALALLDDFEDNAELLATPPSRRDWVPPRDLLDAIERAVLRHSSLARRVLSVLATAGRPANMDIVASILDIPTADVRAAAVELLAQDRVIVSGDEMWIAAPLWQSAVYHIERDSIRQYLHQRWAEALLRRRGTRHETHLIEVAVHEQAIGRRSDAADHFSEGASAAIAAGAFGEARLALEHATRLAPATPEVLVTMSEVAIAQGRDGDALAALESIDQSVDSTDISLVKRIRIARLEASHRSGASTPGELLTELSDFFKSSTWQTDAELLLRAVQLKAEIARDEASEVHVGDTAARLHHLLTSDTPSVTARGLLTSGFLCWHSLHFRKAARLLRRAATELLDLRLLHEAARANNGLGVCLHNCAAWSEAFHAFRQAFSLAMAIDNPVTGAVIASNTAAACEDSGLLDTARTLNEIAISLLRRHAPARYLPGPLYNYGDTLLLLGHHDAAQAAADEGAAISLELGDERLQLQGLIRRVDMALARGDHPGAIKAWEDVAGSLANSRIDPMARSRVYRQSCVVSRITRESIEPVDPSRPHWGWDVVGRYQMVAATQWLHAADQSSTGPLVRTMSACLRKGSPVPLNWFAATGMGITTPWLCDGAYDVSDILDMANDQSGDARVEHTALAELVEHARQWFSGHGS